MAYQNFTGADSALDPASITPASTSGSGTSLLDWIRGIGGVATNVLTATQKPAKPATSKTPAASLPSWVIPVVLVVSGLALVGFIFALLRSK